MEKPSGTYLQAPAAAIKRTWKIIHATDIIRSSVVFFGWEQTIDYQLKAAERNKHTKLFVPTHEAQRFGPSSRRSSLIPLPQRSNRLPIGNRLTRRARCAMASIPTTHLPTIEVEKNLRLPVQVLSRWSEPATYCSRLWKRIIIPRELSNDQSLSWHIVAIHHATPSLC